MRQEEILPRATAAARPQFDFTGEWTNELSSTMSIVEEEGVLIGVYVSAVSAAGQLVSGQLSGQAQGDLIAFTVKWPTAAITAWVGRHRQEDDKDVIETLWHMTTLGDDGQDGFWHSIYAGSDRFERSLNKPLGELPKELQASGTAEMTSDLEDADPL